MILHLINHSNTASKKLSEREINLLAFFMLLPEKFKYNRFSSLAKDYVVKMAVENGWNLNRNNINNKIYKLLDKEYIRRDEDQVIYLSKPMEALSKNFKEHVEKKKPLTLQNIFHVQS